MDCGLYIVTQGSSKWVFADTRRNNMIANGGYDVTVSSWGYSASDSQPYYAYAEVYVPTTATISASSVHHSYDSQNETETIYLSVNG